MRIPTNKNLKCKTLKTNSLLMITQKMSMKIWSLSTLRKFLTIRRPP